MNRSTSSTHPLLRRLGLPRPSRRNVLLTLAPVLLLCVLVPLRPLLTVPRCALTPASCSREALNGLDRIALDRDDELAEAASKWLQVGGTLAVVAAPFVLDRVLPVGPVARAGSDLLVLVQVTLWNQVACETVRLAVQRPRPKLHALNPEHRKSPWKASQYTSFYSGHTSYAAAIGTALLLRLRRRPASGPLRLPCLVAVILFVVATGVLRVLEGMHWPSDVVAGAFAGVLVALVVVRLQAESRTRR